MRAKPKLWTRFLLGGLLAAGAGGGTAGQWPGWRGPAGTGMVPDANPPLHWDTRQNVHWRVALPGPGSAGPVVWSNRVFIAQATEKCATIMCFNRANGDLVWQCGIMDVAPGGVIRTPPRCSATPVTDGERVIALFGSCLYCLDFNGEELWSHDFDHVEPAHGHAASPLLHGHRCLVHLNSPSRLVAVDKRTGRVLWETAYANPDDTVAEASPPPADAPCTTPILLRLPARDELVLNLPHRLAAYAPATGALLWTCAGLGATTRGSPLWGDHTLVGLSTGPDACALALSPGGQGDVTASHRRWRRTDFPSTGSPGVIHWQHLYTVSDQGLAACRRLKTGEVIWQKQLQREGIESGPWAALLLAGDRLYAPNAAGDVYVLRAASKPEVLATNSVAEPLHAAPAAADDELFLRTDRSLWCLRRELKPQSSAAPSGRHRYTAYKTIP